MSMINLFEAARRVSVPIVAIRTADQAATIDAIAATQSTEACNFPVVQWDAARGLSGVNQKGVKALAEAAKGDIKGEDTIGFVEAMLACQLLPKGTVVCAHNAHRQILSTEPMASASAVQAVANLRATFKTTFRMLVLLGPIFQAPPELEHDVVVLDHALPTPAELETMGKELYQASKLKAPKADVLAKGVDAVSGLSLFAAEQAWAMSMTPDGVDLAQLWERKRVTIGQTQGLSVWRGGERFDDLVGLDAIKAKLRRRLESRTPIGVVLFLDEIDKVFANLEHDTTGVKMDQFRTFLTEMENNEWRGMVCLGVPGAGKSAIAKSFGNEAGVPTIALDLGAMESQFVGASEALLRHAMQVVKAIGRDHAYVIATSNNASVMRPELQRRFTDGNWFFDLMSDRERAAALAAYAKKYELTKAQVDIGVSGMPGWTGAEIRNACRDAWDSGCTLKEASQFIVPIARSRADDVDALRRYAHGRLLDSTRGGTYEFDRNDPVLETALRAINLEGMAVN